MRHMLTLVVWRQSYTHVPEQLDFCRLENSIKIVLLDFYITWQQVNWSMMAGVSRTRNRASFEQILEQRRYIPFN